MSKWITVPVGMPLTKIKRHVVAATLEATKGNRTAAARLLGIDAKTIDRWSKRTVSRERGT